MLNRITPFASKSIATIVLGLAGGLLSLTAAASPLKVAVIGAPPLASWNTDVQQKLLGTGKFTGVDVFDAHSGTPSLATMETYGAVLVYSDAGFANSFALGNNLADYVDAGGGVVVAVFADASVALGGRYVSGGYLGINPSGQTQGTELTLGTIHDPSSPIMAGVTSLDGGSSTWRSTGSVRAGSVVVADWLNGAPLVVTTPIGGHQTVALNFYPPSSAVRSDFWNTSTQGGLLMANALDFSAGQRSDVPEPASLALFGLGVLGLAVSRRKRASQPA